MSRRAFLKGTGVVTVLIAGGTVWRAFDQGVFSTGQGPAYEPWKTWRTDKSEGSSLALVRAAILAANPHNTQPWLFRVTESRVDLFADNRRNIGAIDPYLREMHIGVGCALENLLLAAEANGYAHQLTLLPSAQDSAHAARVDLSSGNASVSELYEAIPNRHTNRGPYDRKRSLAPEMLKALEALGRDIPEITVFWFTTDEQHQQVGDLIIQAAEAILTDKEQSQDSARWFRQTWQDIQLYRDGITLDAQGFSPLVRAVAKILPPLTQEQNDDAWLKATKETHVATAAAFGILAARNSQDNAQRIQGGRLWQRMHLWGTAKGLGLQPLNQMPERADREASLGITPRFGNALKELIGDPDWQALMPFRIGYPMIEALASPRRSIEDVLA